MDSIHNIGADYNSSTARFKSIQPIVLTYASVFLEKDYFSLIFLVLIYVLINKILICEIILMTLSHTRTVLVVTYRDESLLPSSVQDRIPCLEKIIFPFSCDLSHLP